jgi:hypothetical protein
MVLSKDLANHPNQPVILSKSKIQNCSLIPFSIFVDGQSSQEMLLPLPWLFGIISTSNRMAPG